jgi:iron complex transport system substrate-binding protein
MRIASLVPSATEMLFGLGLGESVVAVTHECDYPETAASLPHLTSTVIPPGLSPAEIDAEVKRVVGEGRALYELDEDRLAELEPDVIVTQRLCQVCAVSFEDVQTIARRLPSAPRVLLQDPVSLAEMLDDVTRLGRELGDEETAGEYRAELEGMIASVRAAVSGAGRPRTLALEWLDPPFVGGHWVPEMIEAAGGVDVIGKAGKRSEEVRWEGLEGLRPEVVVVMPCGFHVEEARSQAVESLERLRALGAERIHAVDAAASFSRPGPRLIDGIELLGHLLHPEAVAAPGTVGFAEVSVPVG